MWSENKKAVNRKVRLVNGNEVVYNQPEESRKLSKIMAMVIGAIVTLEIMVASAMIFDFDVYCADKLAMVLAFIVVYFGVVAALTDR